MSVSLFYPFGCVSSSKPPLRLSVKLLGYSIDDQCDSVYRSPFKLFCLQLSAKQIVDVAIYLHVNTVILHIYDSILIWF